MATSAVPPSYTMEGFSAVVAAAWKGAAQVNIDGFTNKIYRRLVASIAVHRSTLINE